MINSRSLDDLLLPVKVSAQHFLQAAADAGIDVIVTSTYRDLEQQAFLYQQGRTRPGPIVTNAKPGESFHNWKCAFDFLVLRDGKVVGNGDDPVYQFLGELGESLGMEWAGRWTGSLRESGHLQWTGGLTLAQLQAGQVPGESAS